MLRSEPWLSAKLFSKPTKWYSAMPQFQPGLYVFRPKDAPEGNNLTTAGPTTLPLPPPDVPIRVNRVNVSIEYQVGFFTVSSLIAAILEGYKQQRQYFQCICWIRQTLRFQMDWQGSLWAASSVAHLCYNFLNSFSVRCAICISCERKTGWF